MERDGLFELEFGSVVLNLYLVHTQVGQNGYQVIEKYTAALPLIFCLEILLHNVKKGQSNKIEAAFYGRKGKDLDLGKISG